MQADRVEIQFGQIKKESSGMAFVNEKISDQDRQRISSLVNYEKLSAISRWIHRFQIPSYWTADHGRRTYLIKLGGGGSPDDVGRMPYAVLAIDDQIVLFNVVSKDKGNAIAGIQANKEIHNLSIPPALESRKDEIKQLIREALEENVFFDPFADGGTVANPNTVARSNVISINVEFK